MNKKRVFGELELAILNIMKSGKEFSVKDVLHTIGEENSYTTIMTVMSRLAEKGELQRRREGRQYIYMIASAQQSPSLGLLDRLKQRLFGGRSSAMISFLIDSSQDLTDQELEEMRKAIDKAKKERGL